MIAGCNFHFGQAVYRKMQNLGFQTDITSDVKFATAFRIVLGLAFVPYDRIKEAWTVVLNFDDFPLAIGKGSLFSKVTIFYSTLSRLLICRLTINDNYFS